MNRNKFIWAFLLICTLIGCEKKWMDVKPNKALIVPDQLDNFQAILDNLNVFNITPGLLLISSDDYQTTENGLKSYLTPAERNSYIWAKDITDGRSDLDWNKMYQQVFYANVVLDGLRNSAQGNNVQSQQFNQIKGIALFFRSYAFYNLIQVYTVPFNVNKSSNFPGIPLKLSADVNEKPGRGTIIESYTQLINDLSASIEMLPANQAYKSRPNKAAAYGLLARIYLAMGNYKDALSAAESALKLHDKLLNYQLLTLGGSNNPFPNTLPAGNDEVLFYSCALNYSFINSALTSIAPEITDRYSTQDLRVKAFFLDRGNDIKTFKGSYSGPAVNTLFTGLATDELILIKAECYTRNDNLSEGLSALNSLLLKRYEDGGFTEITSMNKKNLLELILLERKKELVGRGIRWSDLRRLNFEDDFKQVLTRNVGGITYNLEPNDKRYAFPIPLQEITISGIAQNER